MFTQGRIRVIALAVADVACLVSVWAASVYGYWLLGAFLRTHGWPGCPWGGYDPAEYLVFLPVAAVFVCVNAALGLYHGSWMYPSAPLSPVEEFRRLCISSLLTHAGVVVYIVFAYQTTDGRISRAVCAYACALAAVGAQSFRNWMRAVLWRLRLGQIPVVLAGGGAAAHGVAAVLDGDSYSGMRIVGYFAGTDRIGRKRRRRAWNERDFQDRRIPYLGTLRDIVPQAKKRDIKMLIACQDERQFRAQMDEFASWFTYIDYLPTAQAFPVFGARAVSFDGLGGLEMVNQGRMRAKRAQKRVVDTLLAVVACVFALPLFLVIPVLVKLTSRGSVFYRQDRLGRGGRPFKVWKFRSMYADADARLARLLASDPKRAAEWRKNFKLSSDPRITPFGRILRRTSLDELPQLFNVVLGQMALIGPRPIVADEVERYGRTYRIFSSVKPGVTGLWQVSGRSDTDYVRRVALDAYYVLNWSSWMDFWILLRTIYAVVFMRGAR
ncbi:MAG: exopolysaccharide biosynthesis polyprenyl glycosylphosphotransferase [Kiritimatiellae bacterium]|nr:exopolysaccharide biosynthesis polyprenyl glycosylphosphotransferase [Kiritimatiellia bacterium]